jgi:hypothetical protein
MQPDTDWVGRDLQRLARESKLLRKPTEEEWKRIWRAATDWADGFGITTTNVSIEDFVREHAPGVLREADATSSNTLPQITPAATNPPSAPTGSDAAESRDRARRSPRASDRSKPTGKPAAG